MPPKIKITKEDIIKTSIELVRSKGDSSINARTIAKELNCSTQPIFSNFESMEKLKEATINESYKIYLDFLKSEEDTKKYPRYKSFGMAYIRFAKEEKELFKLLFMRDRTGERKESTPDFEASINAIMEANGLSYARARLMHMEMWSCVHGIGTLLVTSFLPLEWEPISEMLTDIYQGVRLRHLSEEKKNDSN